VSAYALPADLDPWGEHYGIPLPPMGERGRLLDLATRDVIRHLGAAWDADVVPVVQADALRQATAVQAVFRAGQGNDLALGLDDGLASVGPLSFSLRVPPRFSPEAGELLAGLGLYAHTHTVTPLAPPAL